MKAYGRRKGDELESFGGPPSSEGKLNSKSRREGRRLLHKQGRCDNKKALKEEETDREDRQREID